MITSTLGAITTDIVGLERVSPPGVVIRAYPSDIFPSVWKRRCQMLASALRSRHLVIHFSLVDVMFFSLALALIPFHRCKITTLDFFIGNFKKTNPLRRALLRWSLARVDRFLVYFKDSSFFEQELGLPASKFVYIACKINSLEIISHTEVSDGSYIFCGGRSRRDFATLFAAVEELGFPVKIVTSPESALTPHGSSLAGLRALPNVEVFTHDQSAEYFVRTMAAARVVVLPLLRATTTQAGIAVYLQAMALGKCVIISSGLGVSDVLPPEVACIIEAGNADALRNAIQWTWRDEQVRFAYGQAAAAYANSLGGDDDLRKRLLQLMA